MAALEGLANFVRMIIDQVWSTMSSCRIVEILLEKRPELIDLTNSDGHNALHYAAQKNHPRAVELLLSKQSELAYMRNLKNLWSPLHMAAHYGSTDAIKALLRHCPDVAETVDSSGRNAFHVAVVSNKVTTLKRLLRHVREASGGFEPRRP
ncbi:hypothetical protein EJB05_04666, partial [Eragrostis curvula]